MFSTVYLIDSFYKSALKLLVITLEAEVLGGEKATYKPSERGLVDGDMHYNSGRDSDIRQGYTLTLSIVRK